MLERLLRVRDAPDYLGMDRIQFNAEVRPNATEILIGGQGIAFDHFALDARVDNYIAQHRYQNILAATREAFVQ